LKKKYLEIRKQIKILFIIHGLRTGGKERQFIELLKGINKKDISVKIILLDDVIEYNEFFKLNISHKIIGRNIWRIPFVLFGICKKYKPDIIHSWDKLCTMLSVPTAKLLNIKLIDGSIRYAAPIKLFSKGSIISKINFSFVNIIIANSKAGLKTHNLLNKNNAKYIHNGFDFNRVSFKIDNNIKFSTKYIVGMVARFASAKDFKTFIKAGIKMLNLRNDITFVCVGTGPNLFKSKKSVPENMKNGIQFIDSNSNIEEIIKLFDICVLTNNTNGHAEGISNSIMEYMALGKPVIATNAGGNKELILDKVSGFLIKPFDINDLIKKMEILLTDRKKRISMGKAGSERIKKNFNLDKMVNSYIDIYKTL